MKTTVAAMVILLCATACAFGGSAQPATTRPVAERDAAVLNAIFSDMLTQVDEESPVSPRRRLPDAVLFSMTPTTRPAGSLNPVLVRHEPKKWDALPKADMEAANQAAENLRARFDRQDYFAEFAPADARVKLFENQPPTTRPSFMSDRPISAWTPGYSKDGHVALVRMTVPWSMHHADATYLLRYADGRWVVVLRQFIYYV